MNLHQFRFIQEAVRRNLNLTETAKALFTSQPGVSKAIIELEEELGIDIFVRHGKRLRRVTEPGLEVLKAVDIIMREVSNLRRIGDQFSMQDAGTLSIATTHTQARYFLPEPVAQLRKRLPKVQVVLHQGMPAQVAQMLLDDVADIGLATESLADYEGLVTLPCYEWQHVMVVPQGHPLASVERPTLEQLAAHSLVLYHHTVTAAHALIRPLPRHDSSPTWPSKPSIPTSSKPTSNWAWAWASWRSWPCATNPQAVTWWRGHWATCSGKTWRGWPSRKARICASLFLPLPHNSQTDCRPRSFSGR